MDALAKVCPKCGRRYEAAASFCQKDGSGLLLGADERDPYIGQKLLDQFEIVEAVGAGGMGTVYRARQATLNRDVAIKILHPELADNADAVRRFKREARVCTALDHPNVVRVFLFGQLPDGSLYIVMEHLEGRPLLDVLRADGALPVHRALHVATQICDGVGEAHSQGVVHRDLKPENVVLVKKARDADFVKVLDFGIARVLWGDDVTQATQTGLVFGTARYISPEGAAGEPTDARSDVYSLGVLTYQLLSGQTPHDAPSPVAMLMKHIHADAPHLLTQPKARHVPDAIADVVMRSLSKNPEGRYDDAHELGEALRRAAETAGFEVHGAARRSRIGPRSSAATPVVSVGRREPSVSHVEGSHLQGQASASWPSPRPDATPVMVAAPYGGGGYGDDAAYGDDEVVIPGLSRPGASASRVRKLGIAFVVGAALVGAGFAAAAVWGGDPEPGPADVAALTSRAAQALEGRRYDAPPEDNVLALTAGILAEHPRDPEAHRMREFARAALVEEAEAQAETGDREAARGTYERALAFAPRDQAIHRAIADLDRPVPEPLLPGVRTEPLLVLAGVEITLVGVVEEGTPMPERADPRFLVRRGAVAVGRSVRAEAVDSDEQPNREFRATYTFARPGTYRLLFRLGRGSSRVELETALEVLRDPDRPRPRRSPDPPPVTTQGSTWTPSPTQQGALAAAAGQPSGAAPPTHTAQAPTAPTAVRPAAAPPPDPPPPPPPSSPPPPWTTQSRPANQTGPAMGSVL